MRVLWVEDQFSQEKQRAWFGNSQRFEIDLIKDYTKAHKKISENMVHYDLIFLDIDLTESDSKTTEIISKSDAFSIDEQGFLKEAGFHLYVQLLEQGFDKERVVFLTGNASETPLQHAVWSLKQAYNEARKQDINKIFNEEIRRLISEAEFERAVTLLGKEDLWAYLDKLAEDSAPSNTYNKFKQRFHAARMLPPHAIRKKADHDTMIDIATWLRPRLDNPYLRLRYAIVEMVRFIDESLNDDDQILFNRYISKTEQQFSQDDLRAYLNNLSALLPQREPSDDLKARIYKQLLRALVHEWDDKTMVKNDLCASGNNQLTLVLKTLRNWIAHGKWFEEKPTEAMIAYLFWLNCRMMFDFGSELCTQKERLLVGVFDKIPAENELQQNLIQLKKYLTVVKQELKGFIETHNNCPGTKPILGKNKFDKPFTRFIHLADDAQRNAEFSELHGAWLLNHAYCFFWEYCPDKKLLEDSEHYLGTMGRCLWRYSFAD